LKADTSANGSGVPIMAVFQEAVASLVLSAGLVLVALALLAWLRYERNHREAELSHEDTAHFSRQDTRRAAVAVILGILAVGIFVGSRVRPVAAGRVNPLFLQIWLSVSILVVVIVVLAMIDWLATRAYARRHFRQLAKERLDLLRDELRYQARSDRNGAGSLGDSSGT
jgi:hypothetical protein